MYILGISAFYHDAAACLLKDGEIVAGIAEERLSRIKHDFSFPMAAIKFCLEYAGIGIEAVDYVVFYEKPLVKFERIIKTFAYTAPRGRKAFVNGLPDWIKNRLWSRNLIKGKLGYDGIVLFTEHHESHAASAYLVSPFEESAIFTVDGVGEWATTTMGYAEGESIEILKEIHFPNSLGLLYSTFTAYLGFKVNSGEYKVMGMAAYGSPIYYDLIMNKLIEVKKDGSFALNMDYFSFLYSQQMHNSAFNNLFGDARRTPSDKVEQVHFDIAASIQRVIEDIILNSLKHLYNVTRTKNLCMAGGVALNSVCNGRIVEESDFESVYVPPDPGDGGGALGCAKYVYHACLGNKKTCTNPRDEMKGSYIGPSYSEEEIGMCLEDNGLEYRRYDERAELVAEIAKQISEGRIIGFFQGRMEWGPRALGNRSIIADPRDAKMKDKLNSLVKFREEFRPFAPTVLWEHWRNYFEINGKADEYPYMLVLAKVREEKRKDIPAITHVDGTARIQTLKKEDNPFYYDVISRFAEITNVPVVLNTSFNIRGEPIVCTPEDALKCFMRTKIDTLVMEDYMVIKEEQKLTEDVRSFYEND